MKSTTTAAALTLAGAALTLSASTAWPAAEAPADALLLTAYLVYPANGAVGVPANTRVFVAEVTAVELSGPSGERLPALLDTATTSSTGGAFVPFDELTAGLWRVLAIPSPDTDNYAGEGVTIELGTFTVDPAGDDEAPWVDPIDATWSIGARPGFISVTVTLGGQAAGEPILYEIDLGDRDTLMEGVPDAASAWTPGTSFGIDLGDSAPEIEPDSASVRVRAMDAAGNVGEWSDPIAFDLVQTTESFATGCRAAPGAAGSIGPFVLLSLVVGLVLRRRG